jgi:hypothetical protein
VLRTEKQTSGAGRSYIKYQQQAQKTRDITKKPLIMARSSRFIIAPLSTNYNDRKRAKVYSLGSSGLKLKATSPEF